MSEMNVKIKICGLTRPQDIDCVNKLQPDYIGFVFAKSKRQVSSATAAQLKAMLSSQIKAVGVFVNDDAAHIARLANSGVIDLIQLHGDEDAAYCTQLKKLTAAPLIKAVRVRGAESLTGINAYLCDYFLFDTYVSGAYGGSGQQFDTSLLAAAQINRPYFIAGGLNAENIGRALQAQPSNIFGVDVSGGVETNGVKDPAKIAKFIAEVRRL